MAEKSTKLRLPPGQQLVARDKWPLVGERHPERSDEPWMLSVGGSVSHPCQLNLDDLRALPQTDITIDIHCVTRWSKYDVRFSGVLLRELIQRAGGKTDARFVSFVARSEREHSSSLPLAESLELGTLMAISANGNPLTTEHGGPIRAVVPGKYFYKSVKWVERIELLPADRLGFWESDAGYHNGADPWREQRYIAATIDKREAAKLIQSRDFSHQDLLSLDASERSLAGLNARRATLRNADFSGSDLQQADFGDANLSNAQFRSANLQGANFEGADLEGADFAGADLRGANLSGCSLFGTSFGDADRGDSLTNGALFDAVTIIHLEQLQALTPIQHDHMVRLLCRK